jgi:hypothetical protein
MAGDGNLCNQLLRLWESRSNFNILNPLPTPPYQNDHFFEVQHVSDILFAPGGPLTDGNFYDWQLGYFIDISSFISGHGNLFQINATDNQRKKQIPWSAYAPGAGRDPFITNYLAHNTMSGETVLQLVQETAVAMANRPGTFNTLTMYVGQQICTHMGWAWTAAPATGSASAAIGSAGAVTRSTGQLPAVI